MITGILVALPEELHTLSKFKIKQGECSPVSKNILVTLSGSGPDNASNATHLLINRGAKQLISWGCAGALAPYLKAGDLIIPELIETRENKQLATDTFWSELIVTTLQQCIKCYTGKIVESGSVVALAQDKAEQYQQTGALAIDMESAAVARIAQQANIPFVAIRSIADPANLDLPKAISFAMTDTGVISIARLMKYICIHPTEIPALIKLGFNFNAASKTLKQAAIHLPQITQVQ
ncbi:MAG: phosphorylase [Gammaproteobacteria bacterium]|nr:MAG: phosphorylase [Gammaproteobacteria bacterium]